MAVARKGRIRICPSSLARRRTRPTRETLCRRQIARFRLGRSKSPASGTPTCSLNPKEYALPFFWSYIFRIVLASSSFERLRKNCLTQIFCRPQTTFCRRLQLIASSPRLIQPRNDRFLDRKRRQRDLHFLKLRLINNC